MGDSPKWVKSKKRRKREREKERLNDGDNNGRATHGARKHAWRTQAAWAKIFEYCKGIHLQVESFRQNIGCIFQSYECPD